MKGFDTLKIKSGVKARNKINLNFTHLTTLEFAQILPLMAKETVPGDEWNVNANFFSRLAPLVRPTYGKFSFKTVYAYVPYHMVAADAEAWFAGKTAWEGYTPVPRQFTYQTLHTFLTQRCLTTTGATAQNTVYTYKDYQGNDVYNIFTDVGKYYVKVLNALGYNMPTMASEQSSSYWQTNIAQKTLSAYPLLAFFKLYNDYMSQSQRFNTSGLSNILNAIKYGKAYSGIWNEQTGILLPGALIAIFAELKLNYENDYFTSAWQSANAPLANVESVSSMAIPESGNPSNTITVGSTRTYATINTAASGAKYAYLAQRTLDFLKSFDNWVRRNNYSGSRAVQQVYSRFGIKTSDYRDHYANVITTEVIPVQIGDVTATYGEITNGTTLGDYSGKGIMNGNKSINYKCDDFGMIFCLGYFTVTPMNAFGTDRSVLRTDPLDYYNPEFDGLGADAISVGEYFGNPADNTGSLEDDNIYGYTERYNSYRYSRDVITGEFREYGNGDMSAWHTGRNLSTVRNAGYLLAQNESVNTMPQVNSEYNRMFAQTYTGVDHFYLTAQFAIDAIRPMMNLNQVTNLGEGNTVVPRNGNVIS